MVPIIVSGKDDCSDAMLTARQQGMKEAVVDLPNRDDILLDFYGRDRISTWLRQHPGVSLWARSRLGKPLSGWMPFGRWTNIASEQKDEFYLDDPGKFIRFSAYHRFGQIFNLTADMNRTAT